MDATSAGDWMDVIIPNPRPPSANVQRAAEARRLRTRVHKAQLLKLLTLPPSDYDGTNKKLAEYMGMSERTISRLLAGLARDGKLKIMAAVNRRPGGGLYTKRLIQIRKEE